MQFAITSLTFLQGNTLFVSGSRSGNLRVWKVDGTKSSGDTILKEEICITGAHSLPVTAVVQGPQVNDSLSFSSASEDGKVLSFAIPATKVGSCNPCCFNVVNHGIAYRYFSSDPMMSLTALSCLSASKSTPDVLLSATTGSNAASS